MNKLLPKIDEMQPFLEVEGTFSHCKFTKDFCNLTFKDKLQTINDLVRQTMMFNETPNPKEEQETLIGDSLTSALVSASYLKDLGVGEKCEIIWLDRKSYEPEDMVSNRFAVIVYDGKDKYLFDATPQIGYGCGKVKKLEDEKIFSDYKVLEKNDIEIFLKLRTILFEKNKKLFNQYERFLNGLDCKKNKEFSYYVSNCYEMLARMDKNEYNYYMEKAEALNPYINIDAPKSTKDIVKKAERDAMLYAQINKWESLILGFNKNKTDFVFNLMPHKQIEVAQNIFGEYVKIDKNIEPRFIIDGQEVLASHISPRWCKENEYNLIMIKPSAYSIKKEKEILDRILKETDGMFCSYSVNLGNARPFTQIKPLMFSHSVGLCVERQMTGPSNIVLIKGNPDHIKKKKKEMREEYGKNLYGKETKWLDGEKILWERWSTNFLHSTDNYVEASLHFLMPYPECQLMTRFMYPNPKLTQENDNKKEIKVQKDFKITQSGRKL